MNALAKLNLCLYLGGRREDGLHELCSLFQPLQLADRIVVAEAPGARDEVVCEGVEGPNLAAAALAALRDADWQSPPLRIEIEKRIPVAAGLGGGSADAAAVLRLAEGEVPAERLAEIAAGLGADVPSQLSPEPALVTGAGERIEPVPPSREWAAVLLPDERGLSTAEVYAEADRLGLARDSGALSLARDRLLAATAEGASPLEYTDLLVNDLGEAAISLRPEIGGALEALREAGAGHAIVTGSGPTAVGIFPDIAKADAAAAGLAPAHYGAIVTAPAMVA